MEVLNESENGITVTLHSDASKTTYQGNTPSAFTNVLKYPIRMSHNENYEACLTNIHIPAYQSLLLKKSDSYRNYIKFNIGLFIYDEQNADWKLMDDSKIDLWSYSLNKDVSAVELDNDVSRSDFVKRLNTSFNFKEKQDNVQKKKQCLALFYLFLRHKYETGHDDGTLRACTKCKTYYSSNSSTSDLPLDDRPDVILGDIIPHISFIEEFDINRKDHIWLKHLEDLTINEKYNFFDTLFNILDIDKYKYLRDIIHKNLNFSKIQARRYVNRIKDSEGNEYKTIQNLFVAESYKALWKHKKLVPQLVLYATFGDKMCDYLSINRDTKIVIVSCADEKTFRMYNDNLILTPKFNKEKFKSLFIYSDIVQKTRFGDYMTNLLGIVTMDNNIYTNPTNIPIFRPVSHNFIQSISIRITDHIGESPNFQQGSYTALEIIIRKQQS